MAVTADADLMKITKFAHSCLLVEEGSVRILTDPGNYSTKQNDVKNIDAVLVTHEHPDHCDPSSLKAILANSPNVRILTNKGVGALLDKEGISYSLLERGQSLDVKGVKIETYGEKHAMMYPTWPIVDNTGYLIAGKLFHPGDSFTVPSKKVELLALPVAAPWLKLSEYIDYVKAVKPKTCFPVHDAMLKSAALLYTITPKLLESTGIKFVPMDADAVSDF